MYIYISGLMLVLYPSTPILAHQAASAASLTERARRLSTTWVQGTDWAGEMWGVLVGLGFRVSCRFRV